jgi:hypothetical protein
MTTEEEKPKHFCYCGVPADYGYYDYFEGYKTEKYYCNEHHGEYHHLPIRGLKQEVDHITCKHIHKRKDPEEFLRMEREREKVNE